MYSPCVEWFRGRVCPPADPAGHVNYQGRRIRVIRRRSITGGRSFMSGWANGVRYPRVLGSQRLVGFYRVHTLRRARRGQRFVKEVLTRPPRRGRRAWVQGIDTNVPQSADGRDLSIPCSQQMFASVSVLGDFCVQQQKDNVLATKLALYVV